MKLISESNTHKSLKDSSMTTPGLANTTDLTLSPGSEGDIAGNRSFRGSSEYKLYESGRILLNGKYMHLQAIQNGTFGNVTLAHDVSSNTKVAIKAMYKSRDVEKMARHEINILSILGRKNENICQLLNHFETEDFVILVLEYCAQGDLYDMIHSSNYPLHAIDIWNISKDMYSGIAYSHSLGISHRDLKPENILFTESGRVKICDWGLATLSSHSTIFNVGTEKYMAPECIFHPPKNSASDHIFESYDCKAADLWSFGVTLLTAIFGKSPFKAMSNKCGDNVEQNRDPGPNSENVEKSLKWDTNFKNFVLFNKPEVLYDIYPDMSQNCFKIFMNILKVGGLEDDLESFNSKIQLRNLDKFIDELQSGWKSGFTIWDEDLFIPENNDSLDTNYNIQDGTQESVFDMDDFTENSNELSNVNPFNNETVEERSYSESFFSGDNERLDVSTTVQSEVNTIPVPSLTESSYQPKSWYDLDDDLDDEEMVKLLGSIRIREAVPVTLGDKSQVDGRKTTGAIHILNQDVEIGSQSISWSDY